MTTGDAPELTNEQKRWAFAGSTLFLTAVGFLGYAVAKGAMLAFAFGWVALQIFGFVGALYLGKGNFAHPLFKSQVFLHLIALVLLVAILTRVSA